MYLKDKKTKIQIRVSDTLYNRIRKIALKKKWSTSETIRKIILKEIEHYEDI